MYKDYFNLASQLIYIIAAEGHIIEVNDAVTNLTGIEKNDMIDKALWELPCWLHSEQMQNMVLFSMEQCAITMEDSRFAAQYKAFNGDIIDLDFLFKPVFDENEVIQYFVGLGYNITELVKARKALSNHERQMNALFENSKEGFLFDMLPEGINVEDYCKEDGKFEDDKLQRIILNQKLVMWNSSFKNIYAHTDESVNENPNLPHLLGIDDKAYKSIIISILDNGIADYEYEFTNNRNEVKICELNFCSIVNEGLYYGNFCVISDVTLTRQYEAELRKMAMTDFLTGLNNRRTFFSLSIPCVNEGKAVAAVMFDIDKFKSVNDTYGHDTGDIVLKNFSSLLDSSLSKYGVLARLGGEEFALLITDLEFDEGLKKIDEFRVNLSRLEHTTTDGQIIKVTVSIGVRDMRETDVDIDEALNQADLGLYEAKETGRNKIVIYDPSNFDEETLAEKSSFRGKKR